MTATSLTPQTPAAASALPAGIALGPFDVRTTPSEVAAFREAIGASTLGIPLTFPIRWLALPHVRAKLAEALDVDAEIPVHEGQTFEYERPLVEDTDYVMMLLAQRLSEPPRIIIRAVIADRTERLCLQLEMALRVLAAPATEVA